MKKLVDIGTIDPSILLDIRYATQNNFTKKKVYSRVAPLLIAQAAEALARVQKKLRRKGFCLKIWDAYRPLAAQKKLWKVFPNEDYVANPLKNPPHCQGIAVDLTLVKINGDEIEMPTDFDEFSLRAHRNYPKTSRIAARHSKILEKAMEAHGFKGFPTEWWHYDFE